MMTEMGRHGGEAANRANGGGGSGVPNSKGRRAALTTAKWRSVSRIYSGEGESGRCVAATATTEVVVGLQKPR
jgi:hypothetical protein